MRSSSIKSKPGLIGVAGTAFGEARWNGERGAALLAALCFTTILGISLASYLTLTYRTLELSNRSMQANRCVQLAELGIETALWSLNKSDWTNWTFAGTTASRTLTGFTYDNGVTGSATLTITNYDGTTGTRKVTATGTTVRPDGARSTRTLTSTMTQAPVFLNAVAATSGRVKFMAAGTVDSYDSSLGDYGSQTPGYSAILSSGSTSVTSATVQLTNAQVKGYVATLSTGPSYSTSARLQGPTTPGTTLIDTSRITTSPYQPNFEERDPWGTSTTLPTGSVVIGSPGVTALYTATDVTIGDRQVLVIDGPVTLNISGNLTVSASGCIYLTANGSLDIHLGGDLALDGAGIVNTTKLPRKLAIIAKSDNDRDTLEIGTTMPFYGVIYLPNNTLTVNNNGTFFGAIVGKSVIFNHSPAIHYDVNLRSVVVPGLITPYAISTFRESTFVD